MFDHILGIYDRRREALDSILNNIKGILKDESIPVDDRWDFYIKVEQDLPIYSSYFDVDLDIGGERKEVSYYEDLYCDRYQTISFSKIINTLMYVYNNHPKEAIDDLKNRILISGYGGCINDW